MTDSTGAEREMSTADELMEDEAAPSQKLETAKIHSPWSGLRSWIRRGRIQERYLICGILLIGALVSVALFFLRGLLFDSINLSSLGYAGVFIFSLLGAATIFLPSGGSVAVIGAGAVLNPVWVGLLAGAGATIGELTGYIIGYEGGAVLEKHASLFAKAKRWMERRGSITIFVLSAVPNPIFDAAGLAAGAIRFPLRRFLVLVWAGKTIQALGGAFLGTLAGDWFSKLAENILD